MLTAVIRDVRHLYSRRLASEERSQIRRGEVASPVLRIEVEGCESGGKILNFVRTRTASATLVVVPINLHWSALSAVLVVPPMRTPSWGFPYMPVPAVITAARAQATMLATIGDAASLQARVCPGSFLAPGPMMLSTITGVQKVPPARILAIAIVIASARMIARNPRRC